MTIQELYDKIPEFGYCSLHDMFDACNACVYLFPLLKRLDIDWKAVEKHTDYNSKYLKISKDRFFIFSKADYPFFLVHHNEKLDFFEVHCTDVELYEDYFMPDIFKFAIRWNKCEYKSSLESNINLYD